MARILLLLFAAFALTMSTGMMTGCNTTEGFGEDLEATGEALSDKAREEKND